MSQPEQNEEETQVETQTEEIQYIETQELEPGNLQEDEAVAPAQKKKKPEKKEALVREPGKTLFPMSRVQKIIKADKVHRNASFRTYEG
jgi:DNA polymerase epsilon subunit 4